MARQAPSAGAGKALLVVVPMALILAWSQRSEGPSRAELALALSRASGQTVRTGDLRFLNCATAQAGFDCRWEQRIDGVWQMRTGPISTSGGSWTMPETPRPR